MRLVSAWVFEVNRSANLSDYMKKPLRELLECLSTHRELEEYKFKFLASINGAKIR